MLVSVLTISSLGIWPVRYLDYPWSLWPRNGLPSWRTRAFLYLNSSLPCWEWVTLEKIDILHKLLNVSFFESPEVPSRMGPIGGNPATMGSSAKEIGPRACSPWCLPGSTTTPPPSTTRKATTSSAGTPGGRSTGSCAGLKKSSFFFEVLIKFFDRGILLTICSK